VIRDRSGELRTVEPAPAAPLQREFGSGVYRVAGRLFGRQPVTQAVGTRVHFNASRESVWNHLMFYEEVPRRPPFPLGVLLPHPIRSEGNKTRAGANIRCTYGAEAGLLKHIVGVESPRLLQFEVTEQRLGIEDCVVTVGGSYQIHDCGDAADVVLTTNYRTYLHPRGIWHPVEALLIGQLHKHILRGISVAILLEDLALQPESPARSRHSACLWEV